MGLVVISNKPVKKGIEIPEIEITVSELGDTVTFGAIDKEKYSDFLLLDPNVMGILHDELGDYFGTDVRPYFGDEIIISKESGSISLSGILLFKHEV